MEKLDLKKQLKHLYQPSDKQVSLVDVPEMKFLSVDGEVESGLMPGDSPSFAQAIGALYGLAYGLKFMSKQREKDPIDYAVTALEGLWTTPTGGADYQTAGGWLWSLMIMQPEHIDEQMFTTTVTQVEEKRENEARKAAKKGDTAAERESRTALEWLGRVRLVQFHEGLSVQIMHIGPYADEQRSLDKLAAFIEEKGYEYQGRHHEIYVSDPFRAKPENLKTVLRHAVRKVS